MGKVIIILSKDIHKIKKHFLKEYKWLYLGKDINIRQKITGILKEENRYLLADNLHKIADDLRQPFLDFVAKQGEKQKDKLNWWAGELASHSPFLTDFFLLLCYQVLLEKLINEFENANQNIVIFIEDLWLFQYIKIKYSKKQNINFSGNANLTLKKIFLFVKGIIYKFLSAVYLFLAKYLILFYYKGKYPLLKNNNAIGFINYAEERAFKENKFIDPYLQELPEMLRANNLEVFHLINIKYPLSLAKKITTANNNVYPLILNLSFKDIIFSYCKRWKPEFITDELNINGCAVNLLMQREIWQEFSRWGFNYYLIFYKVMQRIFNENNIQTLFYLFENQAWEKMMCLAAEYKKIKLIGVQHSTVPKYYLNFFLGKDEQQFMPLPHKILTTGNQPLNLLQQGGIPLNKIRVGGAWRYEYFWKNIDNLKANNLLISTDEKLILVIFPIDPFITISFYNFLKELFFNYDEDKIKFLLKFHPHTPAEKLNINIENKNVFQISNLPFNELLNKVNIVICSCTTAGIEALILGKKVIRYVPENLISVEPLEGIEHKCLFIINEGDSKDKLLKIINDKIELSNNYSFLQNYFDKINEQVWLDEISKST